MAQELLAERVRLAELGAHLVVREQPAQHRIELRACGQRVAQRAGAREGLLGLGRRIAPDRHEQRRPGDDEPELAAGMLGPLGRMRERLERGGAVGDGLVRGMAVEGGSGGELVEMERAQV